MQRIRRRIGDRALSDKCKSHDEVDRRRFSLVFRKFVFEQDGRQAIAQGGTIPPIMTAAMMS